jgi:hypothetical protein
MMFWHAELVRWVICRKQGIEKAMEIASADETDIANVHGPIWVPRTRPPQGMSVRRILDCKLIAKDVEVGHWDSKGQGTLNDRGGVRWGAGVPERTVTAFSCQKDSEKDSENARQCCPSKMSYCTCHGCRWHHNQRLLRALINRLFAGAGTFSVRSSHSLSNLSEESSRW